MRERLAGSRAGDLGLERISAEENECAFLSNSRESPVSAVCLSGGIVPALVPRGADARARQPRILVYTRNYTPDGKGYVHDNIAASVAAIRKMG